MVNFSEGIREIYRLEELASGTSCVHRLHPLAKLIATLFFIVSVVSFDRYALAELAPYFFFPFIVAALAEVPLSMICKRFLIVLPFCLMIGIANIVFDREVALTVAGISITYGVISFLALLLRAFLCVTAALLLIAVVPMPSLISALRALHVPSLFIMVFEMTYRYISVLISEASRMVTAYRLRSPAAGGKILFGHMGVFLGQLMLRSFDRAERVYQAMKCRGYGQDAAGPSVAAAPLQTSDLLFLTVTVGGCLLCRFLPL